MRYAVIDIGTNSVLMLIAEIVANQPLKIILDTANYTRLGENLLKTGIISPIPLERTITTLKNNIEIAKEHSVDSIRILGTEVFRKAENKDAVLGKFHQDTGFEIEVLTGEAEAEISFDAVIPEKNTSGQLYLVSDIGGGSTEIILGESGNILYSESRPFGAVSLKEKFTPGDPVDMNKVYAMMDFVRSELETITFDQKIATGIAIGGTAATVCAVSLELDIYDDGKVEGKELVLEEIEHVFDRFCSITNEERTKLPGLEKNRADIIIPGTVILLELMKRFNLTTITVSTKGIRYGYLKKYLSD